MSKAEERAEEYCKSTLVGSPYVKKMAYLKAEQDLELTWEDISVIREIILNLNGYLLTREEYCKEVLKRFKEKRMNYDKRTVLKRDKQR